jgi:hypothetical protein
VEQLGGRRRSIVVTICCHHVATLGGTALVKIILLFLIGIAVADHTQAQSQQRKFLLSKFDNYGCQAKGRVQDCSGKVMQEILAVGKGSIPILISQLTDTARTEKPIADYWDYTTSGDIAYFVLTDLFTDADWKTFNMPGVPDWTAVMRGCDSDAEGCWREYLRKHGRKSVQQAWLRAWRLWKDRVYWEPTARCFRISKK